MDLNEIKKLVEEEGGKIIVVEQGEPILVITAFSEYQKKAKPEKKKTAPASPEPAQEGDLKIEDLPF